MAETEGLKHRNRFTSPCFHVAGLKLVNLEFVCDEAVSTLSAQKK